MDKQEYTGYTEDDQAELALMVMIFFQEPHRATDFYNTRFFREWKSRYGKVEDSYARSFVNSLKRGGILISADETKGRGTVYKLSGWFEKLTKKNITILEEKIDKSLLKTK